MSLDLARQQIKFKKNINVSIVTYTRSNEHRSIGTRSILGPTLFLCYINDLFTATKLATFLFADDTSGLAEGKNLPDLIKFMNIEIQKLANWFRSNKMAVNISKTKFIIFRTKGKK